MSSKNKSESNSKRIYMDYAASTPLHEDVLLAMQPYWILEPGNAGELHLEARNAKKALEEARAQCASYVNARPEEVIFTGSGTESNNLGIFGVIGQGVKEGMSISDMHFITTPIEHPSALDCFKQLEEEGASVTWLSVSNDGLIDTKEFEESITKNTLLVSVMYINNEMGSILPIAEMGSILKKYRKNNPDQSIVFHTDASQAPVYVSINVEKLGVDLLTLDAQKMYGPKGIGLLYKKSNLKIKPVIIGGGQEFSLRPSTENIPLIVGFAKAYALAEENREDEVKRIIEIRDYCIEELKKHIPDVILNGPVDNLIRERIANNVNIGIPGISGEFFAIALSEKGIACGTRSACMREGGPSYVLTAMGKSNIAESSLRFSFGRRTEKKNIDILVRSLEEILDTFTRVSRD